MSAQKMNRSDRYLPMFFLGFMIAFLTQSEMIDEIYNYLKDHYTREEIREMVWKYINNAQS